MRHCLKKKKEVEEEILEVLVMVELYKKMEEEGRKGCSLLY
jgi:uncharacterized membrane protein (DUF373 family)